MVACHFGSMRTMGVSQADDVARTVQANAHTAGDGSGRAALLFGMHHQAHVDSGAAGQRRRAAILLLSALVRRDESGESDIQWPDDLASLLAQTASVIHAVTSNSSTIWWRTESSAGSPRMRRAPPGSCCIWPPGRPVAR